MESLYLDKGHPNEAGYELLSARILEALEPHRRLNPSVVSSASLPIIKHQHIFHAGLNQPDELLVGGVGEIGIPVLC